LDAAHEIFQKPFKVEIEYEDLETPEHYRDYPEGATLQKSMKAWRVHPDDLGETNVGLVSDGYGFTDTPDCEFISGGVNSKGPAAVALGRQGNWFLWGFCASPSQMTEGARRAFANTLVYMKRFGGQRPIVTQPTKSRRWAFVYAGRFADEDEELLKYIRGRFEPALLAEATEDPVKLAAYLTKNEGFLHWITPPESKPASSRPVREFPRIGVDEDVRGIGIRNTDPALLDRCIAMLEKRDREDLALRVLERYTDQKHGDDAAAWRRWFDGCRSRLYFTDTGGFRFRERAR
jgi:hypothetical protein